MIFKTKFLPFAIDIRGYPSGVPYLKMCEHDKCCCETIEVVRNWKYLGLEIDTHLRWEYHLEGLAKRFYELNVTQRSIFRVSPICA